jgi:hypothetical protein
MATWPTSFRRKVPKTFAICRLVSFSNYYCALHLSHPYSQRSGPHVSQSRRGLLFDPHPGKVVIDAGYPPFTRFTDTTGQSSTVRSCSLSFFFFQIGHPTVRRSFPSLNGTRVSRLTAGPQSHVLLTSRAKYLTSSFAPVQDCRTVDTDSYVCQILPAL